MAVFEEGNGNLFLRTTPNCVRIVPYFRLANKAAIIAGPELISFSLDREIPLIPELLLLNYETMCSREFQPLLLHLIMEARFVCAWAMQEAMEALRSLIKEKVAIQRREVLKNNLP